MMLYMYIPIILMYVFGKRNGFVERWCTTHYDDMLDYACIYLPDDARDHAWDSYERAKWDWPETHQKLWGLWFGSNGMRFFLLSFLVGGKTGQWSFTSARESDWPCGCKVRPLNCGLGVLKQQWLISIIRRGPRDWCHTLWPFWSFHVYRQKSQELLMASSCFLLLWLIFDALGSLIWTATAGTIAKERKVNLVLRQNVADFRPTSQIATFVQIESWL